MNKAQTHCDIINHGLRDAPQRLELPQKDGIVNILPYEDKLAVIESYTSIPYAESRFYIVLVDKNDIPQIIRFLQEIQGEEASNQPNRVYQGQPNDYPGGAL